ncbi:MAG: hypothetical protein ABGZ35_07570 [Planctomycetaceae bacterium]|jgi:hypothetical protein
MQEPWLLYRLPELIDAETVSVYEGEKAADAIVSIGLPATTSSQGSKSPEKTDWSPLNARHVVALNTRMRTSAGTLAQTHGAFGLV